MAKTYRDKINPYATFCKNWWTYWPYYLKCLVWERYHVVKCDLPPTYTDPSNLLLHSSFKVFCDFIEKEKPFQHTDYDHDADYRAIGDEFIDLYDWWTCRRPERLRREDLALRRWHEEFQRLGGGMNKATRMFESPLDDYTDALRLLHNKYEQWGEQEDEQMLVRLAKTRMNLWT